MFTPMIVPMPGPSLMRGVRGREVIVTRDGPGSVIVPESAQHWAALTLDPPNMAQWNCQDVATQLTPSIGSAALPLFGTALLAQTVSGWTRTFARTILGVVGDGNFHTTDSSLDVAAGESCTWLSYSTLESGSGSGFLFITGSQTNGFNVSSTGTGEIPRAAHNNVLTPNNPGDVIERVSLLVRPRIWYRIAAADAPDGIGKSGWIGLDENVLNLTHSELAMTGLKKGLGGTSTVSARLSANASTCLLAAWKGPAAARMASKSTLTALGWRVTF